MKNIQRSAFFPLFSAVCAKCEMSPEIIYYISRKQKNVRRRKEENLDVYYLRRHKTRFDWATVFACVHLEFYFYLFVLLRFQFR